MDGIRRGRRDRPRLAASTPEQSREHLQPVLHHQADGVGLGLAIVSKIVDEHGGKIAVESEPGQGQRLPCLLPLARSQNRMNKRILVVEDEEKLRRVIELQLQSAGFEVDKRRNRGRRPASSSTAPTWCSPICGCPGMDGLELLDRDAPAESAHSPVIMMTAFGTRRNRRGSHEGGRHRLPAQAVLARSSDAGGPQGARSARAARREPRS